MPARVPSDRARHLCVPTVALAGGDSEAQPPYGERAHFTRTDWQWEIALYLAHLARRRQAMAHLRLCCHLVDCPSNGYATGSLSACTGQLTRPLPPVIVACGCACRPCSGGTTKHPAPWPSFSESPHDQRSHRRHRRSFTGSVERDVYEGDEGRQYIVHDDTGERNCGRWLWPAVEPMNIESPCTIPTATC